MAARNSPEREHQHFDPWAVSSANSFRDFPDSQWLDPFDSRNHRRSGLRRCLYGFSVLAMTLIFATMTTVAYLYLIFTNQIPNLGLFLGIPQFDLIESIIVVWGSLIGVALLWGRWPDDSWRWQSGLLLLKCLIDVVFWALEHATDLGLSDVKLGHEWFRHSLGNALGWVEFIMIADLAGEASAHLGETQALGYCKGTRAVATIGGMIWAMFFAMHTSWSWPLWPLRENPWNNETIITYIGVVVISALCFIQVSLFCLYASRVCGQALREMNQEDRANDLPTSRSDAAWEEFNRDRSKDAF